MQEQYIDAARATAVTISPSTPDGRGLPGSDVRDLNASPSPEPLLIPPPKAPFAASRDSSLTRGRALSASSPQNGSPRGGTPAASSRARPGIEGGSSLERRPSQSYAHYRQTSVVNGLQHSRNTSLLASSSTSPLSPQKSLVAESASPNRSLIVRRSPSLSSIQGNQIGGVGAIGHQTPESNGPQRMPERTHSGRMKQRSEHQNSQAKAQPESTTESRTVGEYALHHLLVSFIREADIHIERCMPKHGEREPRVEAVCGPRADSSFDQLIASLGYINRHKPRSLIDSIIHWRKTKAELANSMLSKLNEMRERVNVTQRTTSQALFSSLPSPPSSQELSSMEYNIYLAERRSAISIYILCRVLIEVISQTTLSALRDADNNFDTASRLESVIYVQLRDAEPDQLKDPLREANWLIRGQLIGIMSALRFKQVSARYIEDLEQAQKKLSIKGLADPRLIAKTEMLVKSMRSLKVRCSPKDTWDHCCNVLKVLAGFFVNVHGRLMKYAYAELFEHLLLPVAATATTELNDAKWKEVVFIVNSKITQMQSKVDHWPYIFPLQAILLCASPPDQFATQWLPLILSVQPRGRDRNVRSHALKAACRLVWRYLYCHNESPNAVSKKLDEIVKLVFQGGRRFVVSTDPLIADPLIQLIRIIGYNHQDICFRTIIFPLMNSELFSGPETELKASNLDPEKTVIAIRAFLVIMADLEKGRPPPFPQSFECDALLDPSSRSPLTHRRTKSHGFTVSAGRTERLSQPVVTSKLSEVAKEYYDKFCKILGRLTIICDETLGGQAVLKEKFATQHTPKTPMADAFTFNKREDTLNAMDSRQHYFDLLHVAVEALPRCLSPQIPIKSLVNLLCTGTAHPQPHIANTSVQSLKSIARQTHAQDVTIGFARFIFKFDDQYATVSDGSLLGPGHIESTLKLYVELLEIWIDDIEKRTRKVAAEPAVEDQTNRSLPLDLSSVLAYADEVESHGLFFLCSPSRVVRAIAVNVLRLVTKFDVALGKPATRVISILEGSSEEVVKISADRLTAAERSRLQKGLRQSAPGGTLVELCSSEMTHDANLWFKIFPNLIQLSSEICLHAVALTRELVCKRLANSFPTISAIANGNRQGNSAVPDLPLLNTRQGGRLSSASPDIVTEQWKNHLIFACTTVTNLGGNTAHAQKPSQSSQHTRKSSKSSSSSQDKIASATELFSTAVVFLSVSNQAVRNAAVTGLAASNATIYPMLLLALRPFVAECSGDAKERLASHQRSTSSPRGGRRTEFLRTEITRLLSLTCHHLQDPEIRTDKNVVPYLTDYAKNLRFFLSDAQIQNDLDFQKLRTYFCVLVEGLYDCVQQLDDPAQSMSFQTRQATFTLIENWCGLGSNESQVQRKYELHRRSVLDSEHDLRRAGVINSAFEKEKSELQSAALSAMAALCAGPLNLFVNNELRMFLDGRRLLAWVNAIFESPSDRTTAIGRRALQNLITHNTDQPYLMAQTVRMCYLAKSTRALASYFEVVIKVLAQGYSTETPFWKILCVCLYTLGNADFQIRTKSARLLKALEQDQGKASKTQDLEISISDKTTAVYKLAQFEVSCRLSKQYPELAAHVFSEFSAYFNELDPDHQRNMVSAMLPWIQTIELQIDPNGGPTITSYMLLVNLFEITVRSSITLHNEIQALWQALATGPYAGNVQLILDIIITICLDKREQNFVVYAKQIVVFLSKTPAGARVVEHLLLQINPRTMVTGPRESMLAPVDTFGLPYVADLTVVLPSGTRQSGLSLGQLCMVLLVDLVVSPFVLPLDKLPALLQVVLVQWDWHVPIVQDQAREMLVHLIHELVISKIEPGSTEPNKESMEDFIESIRRHESKTSWHYGDSEVRIGEEHGQAVSVPMAYVVEEVAKIFSVTYPDIREEWGKTTMAWATSCAVRHVACRSFQVFRCISTTLDPQMLADMLARLSNTIADDENRDYLIFSLEILITLRSIIEAITTLDLLQYPQLFWTTCACLDTIFEREFQEGLNMLDVLLTKMDLSDPAVLKILRESLPSKWEGPFEGLHAMIYKGVRSSQSLDHSLQVMEKLMKLPSSDIVGANERLLFTILANLPRYLHHFEDESDSSCMRSAEILTAAAELQNLANLSRVLQAFAASKYRTPKDFLSQVVMAIRTAFVPREAFPMLVFLLGMVNNSNGWFKEHTMQILRAVIPELDMRKPEFMSQGPDLISPLLRLLHTEHSQQALAVLDNVIDMAGTPLDNKHLRMSMAGSHSSRATRKEYDSTKSLYGIPEESGWSVPMPAIHSAQTRSNVHAVFYTLSYAGLDGSTQVSGTPEIEFDNEDYHDSYFRDRTATMMSDDTRVDGNMGELAVKLDSLDDFFDDENEMSPSADISGMHRYPSGSREEREDLYDQQALPILHRSLNRNPSVSSFQTGFAEMRYPPRREPAIMNPAAFAQNGHTPIRPGLHNRSVTSPAPATNTTVHDRLVSDHEGGDEPESFSDDELALGRAHTTEETQASQNGTKSNGFKAGFRSGLRRLTSTNGSRDARDTFRATTNLPSKSPKVPKLPAAYLRDPASAEP